MNDHPIVRRRGMAACAPELLPCLGGARAADSGPRHRAEGAYDAANATYIVVKGDDLAAVAEAANPAPVKFANASGVPASFVAPGDYSFWELLDKVLREEPSEGSDPATLGLCASIGIEKGKPFNPDKRMEGILEDEGLAGAVMVLRDPILEGDALSYRVTVLEGGDPVQRRAGTFIHRHYRYAADPAVLRRYTQTRGAACGLPLRSVNCSSFHQRRASVLYKNGITPCI